MGNARSAITAAVLQSLQWCAADILPRTFLINMLVICIAVHPADVKGSCHNCCRQSQQACRSSVRSTRLYLDLRFLKPAWTEDAWVAARGWPLLEFDSVSSAPWSSVFAENVAQCPSPGGAKCPACRCPQDIAAGSTTRGERRQGGKRWEVYRSMASKLLYIEMEHSQMLATKGWWGESKIRNTEYRSTATQAC